MHTDPYYLQYREIHACSPTGESAGGGVRGAGERGGEGCCSRERAPQDGRSGKGPWGHVALSPLQQRRWGESARAKQ
ncbi:unnamed protein product [Larinioides sclopetarius]|uniref:Uncharacterized protein n=1 Tax=Larinioides sclopetarius TaxID=280406 RepID=A0AAV1ZGF7_9ARAC